MSSVSGQVARELREQIVRGRRKPGSRLPPRATLARELGTCQATLQEAVGQLVEEGFVEVGPRKKGTRVTQNPPHLSRYRLIFPFGQDDWGQFWHALEAAARQRAKAGREFLCFYGLSGHRDIAEYQEVVKEVQTRRVAGLIFASSADELRGTPLLEHPGLPRAAIAGQCQLPGIPKVHLDLEGLIEQSVDFLLARGRRRIALICASVAGGMPETFRRAQAARGLRSRSCWEQFASRRNPLAARRLVELMFHSGQSERPDGLIIADDNLLTAAGEGLKEAGVRVPDDLLVVAATNFPNLLPSAVPVTRVGFDIPALLDLLVERLEQVRRGESPPENTTFPAVFESTKVEGIDRIDRIVRVDRTDSLDSLQRLHGR